MELKLRSVNKTEAHILVSLLDYSLFYQIITHFLGAFHVAHFPILTQFQFSYPMLPRTSYAQVPFSWIQINLEICDVAVYRM